MTGTFTLQSLASAADPAPGRAAPSDGGLRLSRRTVAEATSIGEGPQPTVAASDGDREARRLRALLTDPAIRINTHRDDASGRFVMQVENRTTGETVEQIPSETLLRLYSSIRERLIDQQA